jgi:hypothetical protein
MTSNSVFIFMAGDNNLDALGGTDVKEMCQADPSPPELNVVIQFDRKKPWFMKGEPTKRFVIENCTLVEKMDLGETNCGDPAVLREFLQWGTGQYQAVRNIVVIWNHGGGAKDGQEKKTRKDGQDKKGTKNRQDKKDGKNALSFSRKFFWREFVPKGERPPVPVRTVRNLTTTGLRAKFRKPVISGDFEYCMVCTDKTSDDFLDNLELKSALSLPGQKFDIVAFDACFMNMLEVLYQIRDIAEIVIGSEESEPGTGWEYRPVLSYLKSHEGVDNATLAQQIVSLYREFYIMSENNVTQSAVRTAALGGVAAALDDFARLLTESPDEKKQLLKKILSNVQKFDDPDYIDLYHFVMLCQERMGDRAIRDAAARVLGMLKTAIIANGTSGRKVKNAFGLSIYFPEREPKEDVLAIYRQLDFNVEYPHWLALITTYHTPGVHR